MFTDRRAGTLQTRRVRQPWPQGKPFKILSLDGGGIKGAYTAEFLRLCEQELAAGRPLREYFDLIAGTSTGGIIALGLALDMPTNEITAFCRDDGRKIFPPLPRSQSRMVLRFLNALQRPRLQHEELEAALRRRFGENTFGEARTRLVIPAFMVPKTEIAVFKTDHHADFRNDWRSPMWKVARATSAAPTYLRGLEHEESGRIFIDGGVWANNPVMVALVDVLSAYDVSREQIQVLSIGTGNPPFELKRADAFGGLVAWREIIRAAMFLTTDNATAQARLLLGPEHCLRIEPSGAEAEVEMDDYDAAYRLLPSAAKKAFDAHREELAAFFHEQVAPRERHHSITARL